MRWNRWIFQILVLACVVVSLSLGDCPAIDNPTMKGVNIGGWLVLESWITPTLFQTSGVADGSGEWEFCQHVGGGDRCSAVLQNHWDTWFTQDDVNTLASAGVNYLRIPVGYWIVDVVAGEPFPTPSKGSWSFLQRALGWISARGIKAVIDLHGAPGSQNGHDNSGRSSNGIHWDEPANINRTVNVLRTLAQKINDINNDPATPCVVAGIELINEPWTPCVGGPISLPNTLMPFYINAYAAIRATGFKGDIWVSDGFCYDDPIWDGALPPPQYQAVFLDTHIYHAFGGPRQQSHPWANIEFTCTRDRPMIANATKRDWTIVGEWSNAIGPATPDTPVGRQWLRAFSIAQWDAYCSACAGGPSNPGHGAFFWNFKIEKGYLEWNYLAGLQGGWALNFSQSRDDFEFSCAAAYDPLSEGVPYFVNSIALRQQEECHPEE